MLTDAAGDAARFSVVAVGYIDAIVTWYVVDVVINFA